MNELKVIAKEWKKWDGDTLVVFAFQEDSPRFLNVGKENAASVKRAQTDGFKAREKDRLF